MATFRERDAGSKPMVARSNSTCTQVAAMSSGVPRTVTGRLPTTGCSRVAGGMSVLTARSTS